MKFVFRASVMLAVVVSLFIILIAATGLHENPIFSGLGAIVVFTAVNIGVVYWGLSGTAAQNGYLKQLGNSVLIGLIAGALIFLSSWVLMSFVFPNYLKEAGQAALDFMSSAGLPKDQIDLQATRIDQATPTNQAFQGTIGTFFTSLIAGSIVAIFKRRKQTA